MKSNKDLVTKLNQQLNQYMEAEDYEKVEEISRELCRAQGLEAIDETPADFLFQIKKREKEEMSTMKKISKYAVRIAAAFAVFFLVGGTVRAAVLYHSGVKIFSFGQFTGEEKPEDTPTFEGVTIPEGPAENSKTDIMQETGDDSNRWLEKKVWEETSTLYSSEDKVTWTPEQCTDRITEYRYGDYNAAAEDTGFKKVFCHNYTGTVFYRSYEHLNQDAETDYSIEGEFAYGNGQFTLQQSKVETENAEFVLLTGGAENERDYVSSSGYVFKLSDDRTYGEVRTSVMVICDNYQLILYFTGMSEEEIETVLEDIDIKNLVDLSATK